ncbi:MAG: DOMON-like domain-containing protein [Steroidobacterales bacterium]
MTARDSALVTLLAHPDSPGNSVQRIAACARLVGRESRWFQYVLEADPMLVRIPPPLGDAGRTDRLWAHTCFEAFVAVPGSPRYLELNFSPSGQWAAYCFDSYRQGMAPALGTAPTVAARHSEDRLELYAEVQLCASFSCLAPGTRSPDRPRLRLALSTGVEDREGRLSYWVLRLPPGRPDFHHAEGFSLSLELASNSRDYP